MLHIQLIVLGLMSSKSCLNTIIMHLTPNIFVYSLSHKHCINVKFTFILHLKIFSQLQSGGSSVLADKSQQNIIGIGRYFRIRFKTAIFKLSREARYSPYNSGTSWYTTSMILSRQSCCQALYGALDTQDCQGSTHAFNSQKPARNKAQGHSSDAAAKQPRLGLFGLVFDTGLSQCDSTHEQSRVLVSHWSVPAKQGLTQHLQQTTMSLWSCLPNPRVW